MKLLSGWEWLFLGCMISVSAGEDLEISVVPSKPVYSSADTVIVALRVKIPRGYVLYGNPTGPGTGRALSLSIRCDDPAVQWLSIKKMKAEKFGPPFGDWVWVYRNETFFFCTGRIISENVVNSERLNCSVVIEGLLCRNSCRLLEKSVLFSLTTGFGDPRSENFTNQFDILKKYEGSITMTDLQQIPYKSGTPPVRLQWKKIQE